jgi:hypothetical protein
MTDVEKAMRLGPAHTGEEARVALLNAALVEAYDKALEDAAQYFDRMVDEGDTEPLSPGAVASLVRETKGKAKS